MGTSKKSTNDSLWISCLIVSVFPVLSVIYLPQLVDNTHIVRFFALGLIVFAISTWVYSKKSQLSYLLFPDLAIVMYSAIYISAAFSANVPSEAIFETLKPLLLLSTYFLLRLAFESNAEQTRRIILQSSFYLLAVILFIVVAQIAYAVQNPGSDAQGNFFAYNVKGTFSHRNILSGYLLLLFPLQLIFLLQEKSRWKRILIKWMIAGVIIILLMLQSRSVYLALGAGAFIYVIIDNLEKRRGRKVWILVVSVIAFVLLPALATTFLPNGQFKDSIRKLNVLSYYNSASGTERRFLWSNTVEMIKENPLLGVGPGNWKFHFPKYGLGSTSAQRFALEDYSAIRPENDFLWIFSETGILGILSYISLFIALIFPLFRSLKEVKEETKKRETLFLLIGLVGFIIFSLFNFPKERMEMIVMLAIYCSIVVSFSRPWQYKFNIRIGSWLWLLFICTSATAIYVGSNRINGELHVKKMFEAKTYEEWESTYRESKAAANQFYQVDHTGLPLSFYSGFSLLHLKRFKEALSEFENAIHIAPYNFHVVNNYGSVLANNNEYARAKPYFEQTIQINPYYDNGYYNLAYTSMVLQNFDEARAWMKKVSANDPRRKQAFLNAIEDAEARSKNSKP